MLDDSWATALLGYAIGQDSLELQHVLEIIMGINPLGATTTHQVQSIFLQGLHFGGSLHGPPSWVLVDETLPLETLCCKNDC